MTAHETITKALEFHGDFFHQRCMQEIDRAGWVVVGSEVPAHVPGDSSAVDIWAESSGQHFSLQGIIECKRSHPDFRVWAFLKSLAFSKIEFPVVYQDRGTTISSDKKTLLIFSDMRAPGSAVTDRCALVGREVALEATDEKLKREFEEINRLRGRRPQGERIASACHQLALGIRSVVRDEVQILQHRLWRITEGLSAPRFYVPVLVTTAKIFCASVTSDEIQLADGTINPAGVNYEEVNWLLYAYPLPEMLQLYPMDGLDNQYRQGQYEYTRYAGFPDVEPRHEQKLQHLSSVRDVTRYKRLPVFVVRASALGEFFRHLVGVGWGGLA